MIEFVHQMNRNYVKITNDNENGPTYGIRMVANNRIEGLLALSVEDINNRFSCLYDISGQMSLAEKYSTREFEGEDIAYIISFIKDMLMRMEKYMLDFEGLVFDPKYVFCDISTGSWSLIYGPSDKKETRKGLRELFEFILERLNHKDKDAVVVAYGVYKRICREEIPYDRLFEGTQELVVANASADTCRETQYYLDEKCNNNIMPVLTGQERETTENERVIGGNITDRKIYLFGGIGGSIGMLMILVFALLPSLKRLRGGEALQGMVVLAVFLILVMSIVALWGFLMYFNPVRDVKIVTEEVEVPCVVSTPMISTFGEMPNRDMERTTLLCQSSSVPCTKLRLLTRGKEREREYMILDSPVSLGSGNQADVLLEYEGISRVHARISREGNMLFLKDMNSTNGTWVNDRQLSIYELCPVRDGDIIRLANTSFELIDTVS